MGLQRGDAPLVGDAPDALPSPYPSGVRLRIATYDCQPYSGALTLFRAEESHGAGFARFPAYGWDQVAETGVRVHTIPGDHVTMFLKPNVDRLVVALL